MTPGLLDEWAKFALRMAIPMCLHDRELPFPKDIVTASCFVIKFRDSIVGVTADHVVDEYLDALRETSTLTCQLRNLVDFNLESANIKRDATLDIATFALTETELAAVPSAAFDCQDVWPPPTQDIGVTVIVAGYLNALFQTDEYLKVLASIAYGSVKPIEDVLERELLMIYDPATARGVDGIPMPPQGANLSGCSGGPVVMPVAWNGGFRMFPIGLISAGANKGEEVRERFGGELSFDMIRARRTNFINPDGTIQHPEDTGLLPGRP